VRESVEGIESFSADVALHTGGADSSSFTLDYDAVIDADPTHEAVVVLTEAAGEFSTPGVLDATELVREPDAEDRHPDGDEHRRDHARQEQVE
jgi:hypothetical protein